MPSSGDWMNSPLGIVQKLYEENRSDYITKVDEFFHSQLADGEAVSQIPSLNDLPSHCLQANSLVRFRCIIQDMYDPELFLAEYESKNTNTGQAVMRSGRYKDMAECQDDEDIECESPRNVMRDRNVYYCIPIPAETDWVKKEYCVNNTCEPCPSTSAQSLIRHKRSYDDRTCPGSPESVISSTCSTLNEDSDGHVTDDVMETCDVNTDAETSKRSKTYNNNDKVGKITLGPDLNFPLSDEAGPACIVKTYESCGETFKVNDMMEFIGVLSIDPAMSTIHNNCNGGDDVTNPAPMLHEEAELLAHYPPPSLVPRLHAIICRKLSHNNPLVSRDLKSDCPDKASAQILCEAKEIRTEVLSVFEQLLFGDTVTAEYLLCHIISTVYSRRDVMALGKFSLNLSACPKSAELPEHLYKILQTILTKVHILPLSLSLMNDRRLAPRKDYDANRLVAGALQLSDQTQLIVDETALEQGQLNDTGVKNVAAIGNLIQWQKVEYDMVYHQTDFPANIPVLVVSEGKSLLPSDCRIQLQPSGALNTSRERYQAVTSYLTPALLHKIRQYVTTLKLTDYTISDQMQKVLEQHFVECRKDDPKSMTHEHFNTLLVLTRLQSLSYGETELSLDVWNRTRDLEKERLKRL